MESCSCRSLYEWQERAVRFANKLGIKPTPSWFKVFRDKPEGLLVSALSKTIDAGARNPEKYFYKCLGRK